MFLLKPCTALGHASAMTLLAPVDSTRRPYSWQDSSHACLRALPIQPSKITMLAGFTPRIHARDQQTELATVHQTSPLALHSHVLFQAVIALLEPPPQLAVDPATAQKPCTCSFQLLAARWTNGFCQFQVCLEPPTCFGRQLAAPTPRNPACIASMFAAPLSLTRRPTAVTLHINNSPSYFTP